MQYRSIRMIVVTAAIAVAVACDQESQQTSTLETQPAEQLTAEQIAQLEAQYPRLGSEPLPEPAPSPDANPEHIPERLRGADLKVLQRVTGQATFYASYFEGRRTASGIPFRQNQMVAAHRAYPFGTVLRVTNQQNNRSVNVRVVDRGPFGTSARARATVVDLSRRAAEELGFIQAGRAAVTVEVLEWGRGIGAA